MGHDQWQEGEKGKATLARLRANDPELTELLIVAQGVGPRGAAALADALETNSVLVRLRLWNNSVGNVGAKALGDALKANTTLREIGLRDNSVEDAGAAAIFANGAHLRVLALGGNRLTTVPASVCGLASLEELCLFDNSALSSVDSGIAVLEQTLQLLDLSNNGLADEAAGILFSFAGGSAHLRSLRLNNNRITTVPAHAVANLVELNVSNNGLDDEGAAAIFASGAKLEGLALGGNSLTVVPASVRGLAGLVWLDLRGNKLVFVDAGIVALSKTLLDLNLDGNSDTLLQPPAPYARHHTGKDAVAALFRYFREEKRPYYRVKMLFIGDQHAGKTSTLRMLREGEAVQPAAGLAEQISRETVGIEVSTWSPGPLSLAEKAAAWIRGAIGAAESAAEQLQFRVLDLAGQVIYRASHQCAFSKNALYVCVVDATDDIDDMTQKVIAWYNYLQDSVPGALFRRLLTHIDDAAAATIWQQKGAELLRRLRAHEAMRRRAMELRLAALQDREAQLLLDSEWGEHEHVRQERRSLENLLTLPQLQPRMQGACEVWGVSNHTGEGVEELRERLVATALDKELLPHVGEKCPVQWSTVESLARDCGGRPCIERSELRRRAAAEGVTDDASFNDALWFWHEVGSLIHYRDVPQLAEHVFVDTSWILALINGLIEQAHKKTFDSPALSRMLQTGVLEHGLVSRLWREGAHPVTPAVAPDDEPMLLELLAQFDLLLPGPGQQTSFVPMLLPQMLTDLPDESQMFVAQHWPQVLARGTAQAGGRFLFAAGVPLGLVERLLARCAAIAGCRVTHCWREGMVAQDGAGNRLRIHSGVREDPEQREHSDFGVFHRRVPAPRQRTAFIDVLLRTETADTQVACRAVSCFIGAVERLLRERFAGIAAEQKLLCPMCAREGREGEIWASECRRALASASSSPRPISCGTCESPIALRDLVPVPTASAATAAADPWAAAAVAAAAAAADDDDGDDDDDAAIGGGGGATAQHWQSARDPVAHAKRCTVQLGVYDRVAKVLKNIGSGAILEGGLVLTAAHNVIDIHFSSQPYDPLVTDSCTVLIGVFSGEAELAHWVYTAEVITPIDLLREEHKGHLLDLALLRITSTVECDPPRCIGKDAVLILPQPQIEVCSETAMLSFDGIRFLKCAPDYELRSGETSVTVIGFAALAGSCIFASPENVVNLADDFLQTRAFIDTGSSGGPVINAVGDIVSVVSIGGGVGREGGVAELAKTRQVKLLRSEHGGGYVEGVREYVGSCHSAHIHSGTAGSEKCLTAEKFNSGSRTMTVGEPVAAVRGIWDALGILEGSDQCLRIQSDGVAEITREFTTLSEHCDDKDLARFVYIVEEEAQLLEQDNGVKRDVGNEGQTLDDFCKQPDACKANLTKAHVLALRLYTSNSYGRVNWPLREGTKPHPYAATTYFIHDAIAKLRATRANGATAVRTFWRGMDDMAVSEDFLAQGGTETGCMSTTEDKAVACKFAKVRGFVEAGEERPNPLLLKVEATSLMDCGADISWLSMYPEEREVLFPPLTYLRPVGKPVLENGCTIITVQSRF
jgi:hypothetical protein